MKVFIVTEAVRSLEDEDYNYNNILCVTNSRKMSEQMINKRKEELIKENSNKKEFSYQDIEDYFKNKGVEIIANGHSDQYYWISEQFDLIEP